MAAVLDTPMVAVNGKELLSICFIGLSAGDAVGDVVGCFPRLFFNRFPFDHEDLSHVGEVEIVVELGGGPDFTSFDPAMIRGIIRDEIRFLAVVEIELDILQESRLIAFDNEVVMGVTLQAYIVGKFSLGKECVSGNVFVPDIDGIEERDGHPDFIGSLELFIAFYGQGADFFWV